MCTNILNIYILRSPQKTVLSFCKKYFLRKKNGESRCGFGQLVPLLKSRGARNSSSKGRNRHFLLILLPVHQHLYKAQKVTFIKFLKTLLYSRSQMQYCECWGKGGGASLTYKIFKVVFDPFWRYEKKNNRPLWNVCPLIFEENSFYLFSFVKYVVCDIKTYHCHLNKIFVPTFGQLLENTDSSHKRSDRKYFKNGKYLPHSKVSTHACYIYQTQNCQTKNVEWIELFWELWPRLRRACWKLFFGGKSNLNGLHRQGEEFRWKKKDTRKGEIMLRK